MLALWLINLCKKHAITKELDNWNELRQKWDEKWNKKKTWNYERKIEVISKHMKVINDNEYGNFYDKSNDNKK